METVTDTAPDAVHPRAEARIADLERQLAELRRDFEAARPILEVVFDAGHAAGRASITGQRAPVSRPQFLLLAGGGS